MENTFCVLEYARTQANEIVLRVQRAFVREYHENAPALHYNLGNCTKSSKRKIVCVGPKYLEVLLSEIPSGMCAKLRTVAASNNRDHARNLSYYCLLAPCIYIFVLRAHPVRGESHNRNATGEVATEDYQYQKR